MKKLSLIFSLSLIMYVNLLAQQLDNLGETIIGLYWVGLYSWAQEFTTGPTSYTDADITVVLEMDLGTGAPSNFKVDIYDDFAGNPNVSIATLSGNNNPFTAGNYTYTGTVTLAPNTSYYIVASATGDSVNDFYRWRATSSGNINELDGFSSQDEILSIPPAINDQNTRFLFSLTISNPAPIPTLSQWGIISLSFIMLIIGLVFMKQRKVIFG